MTKRLLLMLIIYISHGLSYANDDLNVRESTSESFNHAINHEVTAIINFDIDKYMGKWYEIARLPTYFARHCQAPIVIKFTPLYDEEIAVTNSCATVSNSREVRNSVIYINKANLSGDGRLVASSMPAWLRWLPFSKHDYWVIYNDSNYALVATPDRKYLWLLARSESPPLKDVQRILAIAQKQGFNLETLVFDYPSYYVE